MDQTYPQKLHDLLGYKVYGGGIGSTGATQKATETGSSIQNTAKVPIA